MSTEPLATSISKLDTDPAIRDAVILRTAGAKGKLQ